MEKHRDKNIKEVLGLFLNSNKKLAEGYHSTGIEEVWKNRMGASINSYTKKITLHQNVLHLEITSGALRKELLMSKNRIMEIINEEVGQNLIKDIKIY